MKIMNYEEFKLELEKELTKASKNELVGLEIIFSKLVRTNRMMDGIAIPLSSPFRVILIPSIYIGYNY